MFCKTIKPQLVQESLEVAPWRRAGLVAGRFILLRTTRAASSDQVGHSLTLSQPCSTYYIYIIHHTLTSSYFLLLTVTIYLSYNFYKYQSKPLIWSGSRNIDIVGWLQHGGLEM